MRGQEGPRFEVGQTVPRAVVARVRFEAVNNAQTNNKKTDAYGAQPAVYVPNDVYLESVRKDLKALIALGSDRSITSIEQIPPKVRQDYQLDPEGRALAELRLFGTAASSQPSWEVLTANLMIDLASLAALDSAQAAQERDKTQRAPNIIIKHPTRGELDRYDNAIIAVPAEVAALRDRVAALVEELRFPRDLQPSILAVVMRDPRPTYLLDSQETERRKELAQKSQPEVKRTFDANQVIIPAGTLLSETDVKYLRAEQTAFKAAVNTLSLWLQRIAIMGLIALIAVGLWVYISAYNVRILENPTRGAALVGLLLLCQLIAVTFTNLQPAFVIFTTAVPVLLAAIVLAIAYDQRFAVATGLVMALLVAISLNLSPGHLLILLAGVGVAAACLDEVRTRSRLVLVGLWAGLAMGATALLVNIAQQPLTPSLQIDLIRFDTISALAAGLITGLFVQGVLPAIERAFKVTTAMTLKELTDASHPLLRRLAQEAPGTYQHSLRLADIAEAAADAIDANSLLCKVGALYHDIGKINKPLYFIENTTDGLNRHSKLSPAMSLLIIVGHVKDGVEMAREYRLPGPLRHFIESHHGTTLVEYFYHAARKQSDAQQTPAPTEFEFRYPGPLPRTREAAILMLGDSVEASVRTLDEPTQPRIRQLVHDLAQKRLRDGQFNECNLSLSELHNIEESMIKTVSVMYHGRVKYPTDQKKESPTSPPVQQRSA